MRERRGADRLPRVRRDPEVAAAQSQDEVRDPGERPRGRTRPRIREHQAAPRPRGHRTDERGRVRVAADDPLQHDDVRVAQLVSRLDDVAAAVLDPPLQPSLGEQAASRLLVARRELDHGRVRRTGGHELDGERADPAADLQHLRTCEPAFPRQFEHVPGGGAQPLAQVAVGVLPGETGVKELVVPAAAHDPRLSWPAVADYIFTMIRCSKFYGADRKVLDNITLAFLPGAKIGVLGPNGAGKSTVLRIMAGREEPSSGSADLARGRVDRHDARHRERPGLVDADDPRMRMRRAHEQHRQRVGGCSIVGVAALGR